MKPLQYFRIYTPYTVPLHRVMDEDLRAFGLFFAIMELHYTLRSQALSRDDIYAHTPIDDLEALLKILQKHRLVIIDGSIIECPMASEDINAIAGKSVKKTSSKKSDKKSSKASFIPDDDEYEIDRTV